MAQQTLIAPTSAAVAAQVHVLTPGAQHAIVLSADDLAGAETVPVWAMAGNTWVEVTDGAGNQVGLTADDPVVRLAVGPMYGVTKDATAGDCGVYVDA